MNLLKPLNLFVDLADDNKNCLSIGQITYKILASKLNKSIHTTTNIGILARYRGLTVFHIVNSEFGKAIYEATQRNNEQLNQFNNLKFVTIEKQKTVVFLICNNSSENWDVTSIIALADSLCNLLSSKSNKVYINYYMLFDLLLYYENIMDSLFKSLTLEPVQIKPSETLYIINRLLGWYTFYNVHYLENFINMSYTKSGICISNYNVPLSLLANFLNYALDNNSITCLRELFEESSVLKALPNNSKIIFNNTLFSSFLNKHSENDDFVIYKDNNGNTFSKLKNLNNKKKLEDLANTLLQYSLIPDIDILYSHTGDIYLWQKPCDVNYISLKDYVQKVKNDSASFQKLLFTIADFFSAIPELSNLSFYNNTDFTECIYIYPDKYAIALKDTVNMHINSSPSGNPFNYLLVIMQVIKEYMQCNSLTSSDIYSCEFAKVFPPKFINSVAKFIDTEIFEYTKVTKNFNKSIIRDIPSTKIIFIQDLPLNDSNVMSKVSLFKDTVVDEALKKSLEKQQNLNKRNGYLSLDSYIEGLDSRSLDKKSILELFKYSEFSKFVLVPEKVIISKDINTDGTYKILGIIWNQSKLQYLPSVIDSGKKSLPQLYKFIAQLLEAYAISGKVISTFYNCLCSANSSDVFFSQCYWTTNATKSGKRSLAKYYTTITNLLVEETSFIANYDILKYSELVPDLSQSLLDQIATFINSVSNMKICKNHNRWHTPHGMCKICEKSFLVMPKPKFESQNIVYQDSVVKLYEGNICQISELGSQKLVDQLQLGIETDLFLKFTGLRPEKLLTPQLNNKNGTWGIKFSDFDFSSIVPLEDFKQLQKLKVILVMYEKILPYIFDGSFICTDQRIYSTMFMHKKFKGQIIIPNLMLLDTPSIIYTSGTTKDLKVFETKKFFARFLINYILQDEYLSYMINAQKTEFVLIKQDIEQLKFSSELIVNCLKNYNSYCVTHGVYFSDKNILCEKCIAEGIKTSNIVFKDSTYFKTLENEGAAFDGGEANIYLLSSSEILKVFKSHVDIKFKSRILAKALAKQNLIDEFNKEHSDIKIIPIKEIVYMQNGNQIHLKGFTQQYIPDSYKISSLKDKDFIKEHEYQLKDIVEILIKVCKGIEFLHSINGFIGDLNGGNILIKGKNVYIIDIDGMSFDEVQNRVFTNMYIYPPSAENGNITKEDDWYSLAVQAFYYLTYSHPFRGICDDNNVPENEMERMKIGKSLLGPHNIIRPSISIGWEFLPDNLLKYFLDTFEGSKRESMLSILQSYYSSLAKLDFIEIKRDHDVNINIKEHTYIDKNFNFRYKEKIVLANSRHVHYNAGKDDNYIITLMDGNNYWFSSESEACVKIPSFSYKTAWSICDNSVFTVSSDGFNIIVNDMSNSAQITEHTITTDLSEPIACLYALEKKKLVLVRKSDDYYNIYCNSTLVDRVCKNSLPSNPLIQVEYDEIGKMILVLFQSAQYTYAVAINKETGDTSTIKIEDSLSTYHYLYANVLYYAKQGQICCFNINTKSINTIPCNHVTPNSRLARYDNKLLILNHNKAFMYVKS